MYQDENGIYYLHDYISSKNLKYHQQEEVDLTKEIWAFKDNDEIMRGAYALRTLQGIAELIPSIRSNKIGLVAVPPSKVDKESPIRNMIELMVRMCDNGFYQNRYGYSKILLDYGQLLQRAEDIPTAHLGERASYETQVSTITCCEDRLSRLWTHFIILDDVTTTGTSMMACKDILINHGLPERYIDCIALSKTSWE